MKEYDAINTNSFRYLDLYNSGEGAEKHVYKLEYAGNIFAAKVYREFNDVSREKADRETFAFQEYNTYQFLKMTSLAPYVPDCEAIIKNSTGQAIGLLVDWVEGWSLSNSDGVLTQREIDILQERLHQEAKNGIYLDMDMLNPTNLIFSPYRTPRLSFAECILDGYDSTEEYYKYMCTHLRELRQFQNK